MTPYNRLWFSKDPVSGSLHNEYRVRRTCSRIRTMNGRAPGNSHYTLLSGLLTMYNQPKHSTDPLGVGPLVVQMPFVIRSYVKTILSTLIE